MVASGVAKTEDVWDGLRSSWRLVVKSWWVVALVALVFAVAALTLSLSRTSQYAASASLYVTSGSDANAQSAYQGSLASQQRVASYARLVTSDTVLAAALRDSGVGLSVEDAEGALSATTSPDTVLLTVSATDADPARAVRLVDGVANALVAYVRTLEEPSTGGQPLAKLTVVSPGSASSSPISPRPGRNMVLGFLIGGLLGVAALFIRDRMDTKVRNSGDVELILHRPSLGIVPLDENLRHGDTIDFSIGSSVAAESYRRLRTNLEFVSVDRSVSRILITSANESEGKTTTAINLAASLAEAGHRVVLVDADLRKPAVSNRLGLSSAFGLGNLLRREDSWSELIQSSGTPLLDVLASGELPPNPAELLGSERARRCFTELSAAYDYVIVDSPPILPVADASVLSQWVDGILLVAWAAATKRAELHSAVGGLSAGRTPILGSVLNGFQGEFDGYQYANYGSDSSSDASNDQLAGREGG